MNITCFIAVSHWLKRWHVISEAFKKQRRQYPIIHNREVKRNKQLRYSMQANSLRGWRVNEEPSPFLSFPTLQPLR